MIRRYNTECFTHDTIRIMYCTILITMHWLIINTIQKQLYQLQILPKPCNLFDTTWCINEFKMYQGLQYQPTLAIFLEILCYSYMDLLRKSYFVWFWSPCLSQFALTYICMVITRFDTISNFACQSQRINKIEILWSCCALVLVVRESEP